VVVGLVIATAAVGYAAVGERLGLDGLFGRFRASQRLPAQMSGESPFRYPVRLWRQGVEGEVLLRIHITDAGAVDSVELERSSGHSVLDSIAMSGALRLTYHPALQGDRPVGVWAVLPVRFVRSRATAEE
jgi:TonB family protein